MPCLAVLSLGCHRAHDASYVLSLAQDMPCRSYRGRCYGMLARRPTSMAWDCPVCKPGRERSVVMDGVTAIAQILRREGVDFIGCVPYQPLLEAAAIVGI